MIHGAGEVGRNQGIWILFFWKLWRDKTQRSGLITLELWISDDRVARGCNKRREDRSGVYFKSVGKCCGRQRPAKSSPEETKGEHGGSAEVVRPGNWLPSGLKGNANTLQGSLGGASGKEPVCQCRRRKRQVRFLGREDPLQVGMATHSSILAWRIPWTEEPGRTINCRTPTVWRGGNSACSQLPVKVTCL